MILEDIQDYKAKLWLYINAVYLGAAVAFVPVLLLSGPILMLAPTLVAISYFALIVYRLWKNKGYAFSGRGAILIVPGLLLLSLYFTPSYGIYWAFVAVMSLFFMLNLLDASITVIGFTGIAVFLIAPHYDNDTLYRFYAALSLVGFFSFCFAYLIENLLKTLDTMATQDPLTKARNRHTFNRSINEALRRNSRYGTTTVLFIFDLDHFKALNDTYGHTAGDRVLQEVAQIVMNRLRETDLFFRYGGEEFAVLMRNTSLQDAAQVANELRTLIENTNYTDGLTTTISGGLAEVQKTDDVSAWVERCDAALYEAKASGRNAIRIDIPPLLEELTFDARGAR